MELNKKAVQAEGVEVPTSRYMVVKPSATGHWVATFVGGQITPRDIISIRLAIQYGYMQYRAKLRQEKVLKESKKNG